MAQHNSRQLLTVTQHVELMTVSVPSICGCRFREKNDYTAKVDVESPEPEERCPTSGSNPPTESDPVTRGLRPILGERID